MKRLLSLLLLLFFFLFNTYAINLDSLWGIWKDTIQTDSLRLQAFYEFIHEGYYYSSPDSALYYAEIYYDFSKENKIIKEEAKALDLIGLLYYMKGNQATAINYLNNSLKIYKSISFLKGVAKSYNSIGNVYYRQGEYDKALKYYKLIYKACVNKYKYKWSPKMLCLYYNNAGTVYEAQQDYLNARDYYEKALKLSIELGNKRHIGGAYINLGQIHIHNKEYKRAIRYFRNSITYFKDLNDNMGMIHNYFNLGKAYSGLGKYNEAINIAKKAVYLSKNSGLKEELKLSLKALYEIYKTKGDSKHALKYYKQYVSINDSLINIKKTKSLMEKELNYKYDKKARTDSIRNAESNKVKDAQYFAQEVRLKQQKTFRYLLFVGIILVLIFGSVLFNTFKNAKKQKELIESQNDVIINRINQSKKIQRAMLPSVNDMKKSFSDLYVFYDPKDIVSGDFYWHTSLNHFELIACVDCTGHGVPGGFMSTLGSLLIDKVSEKKIYRPADVLTFLNDEVIRTLRQHEGGPIQDGMDMSVCLFDKNKNTLEFSGAKNGIIVIKKGIATRYKADPLPVGGSYMRKGKPIDRRFTSKTIDLAENDWVFMYTDGFLEQPGGPKAMCMKNKDFENYLIRLSHLKNDTERSEYLISSLNNWRGTFPRVDDVLIIGAKLL